MSPLLLSMLLQVQAANPAWGELPDLCPQNPSPFRESLNRADGIVISRFKLELPGRDIKEFELARDLELLMHVGYLDEEHYPTAKMQLIDPHTVMGFGPEEYSIAVYLQPRAQATEESHLNEENKERLFFLKKKKGEWQPTSWRRNGIPIDRIAKEEHLMAICYWQNYSLPMSKMELRAFQIRWLLAMAKNPSTRGYAAFELNPLRCNRKSHDSNEICITARSLDAGELEQLFQILEDCETPTSADFQLYDSLRDHDDPRLCHFLTDFLARIGSIEYASQWSHFFCVSQQSSQGDKWFGDLIYEVITRSRNPMAMQYFQANWRGSLGNWEFSNIEISQLEAAEKLVAIIRDGQGC
jgi:hypothetical protein